MFHSLPKSCQLIWGALVTTNTMRRVTAVMAALTLLTTVQLTPVSTDILLAGLFVLLALV